MSTRAIKKLGKANPAPVATNEESVNDDNDESTVDEETPRNRFAMLESADVENEDGGDGINNRPASDAQQQKKKKKPKKKSKNKPKTDADRADDVRQEDDEIQRILDSLDEKPPSNISSESKIQNLDPRRMRKTEMELYAIEYRHLNAENELKRIFGAATTKLFSGDPSSERRFVSGGSKSRQQGGNVGGKLVVPKSTWPPFGKTGLSMKLIENRSGGINLFAFEHGPVYRQAQFEFWEAVEVMNPDAFVEILRNNPYHVDTLLQLSEVVRMQEDFQMARDLIERAVYGCQVAFHPLFNVATATCRLDYRQRENRPFFLALFKHLQSLCQRACVRTALEFCKLIYSLDPDDDPLCMLLIIDYLALRAKQYDYLLDFYYVLDAKRNLSQLPNFCYSVALATFLKATDERSSTSVDSDVLLTEASDLLLHAIAKFPTTLPAILEKCEVEAEDVNRSAAFNNYERSQDGIGMKQLNALYAARCFQLWKDSRTIEWLEGNVRTIIPQLDKAASNPHISSSSDALDGDYAAEFREYREYRRVRYQGTPRNILRHIVVSDIKEAFVQLPVDVRDSAILANDPLPPLDSKETYERPQRDRRQGNDSFFGAFLRSLLPNYDPEAEPPAEQDAAAAEGGGVRGELQRSVNHLLHAMRDLLNNIQPAPLPPEVNRPRNDGHDPGDDEDAWEDERED